MLLNINTANLDMWCDRCYKMMAIITEIFSQMCSFNSGRAAVVRVLKIELIKQYLYIKKAYGTLLARIIFTIYSWTRLSCYETFGSTLD